MDRSSDPGPADRVEGVGPLPERWQRPLLTICALTCCLAFGWVDIVTGRAINVGALYLLPAAATAWLVGRRSAITVVLAGTAVWVAAEHPLTAPGMLSIGLLNGATRTACFILVCELIVRLRRQGQETQAARDELSRALGRERRSSRTDPLTGLANRRGFLEALDRVVATPNTPFTLALLDLDSFKAVNDEHGHQRGDEVLRRVAEELRRAVREGDTAARLGGDEFAVLFEHTPPEMAETALRRLTRIADLAAIGPSKLHVGVSVGVAHFERAPAQASDALAAADHAMYEAKAAGKGCLVSRLAESA